MKVMRRLSVVIGIASSAAPVLASDEQDCFQGREPELRIRGCTELIQRVPNDAAAYHNRAVAYGLAGDVDNAIADYSKVIEIAPSNASAYENRGRAYASKGDHTHAVEDETKAHELLARATGQPITATPRVSKTTAKSPLKSTPKAGNKVAKETPVISSWWSWLNPWSNSADQSGGKNAKP